MENAPQQLDTYLPEDEIQITPEQFSGPEAMKDYIFNKRMEALLIKDYAESLEEVTDDEEFTQSFIQELIEGGYSDDELHSVLSLPFELRTKMFKRLYQEFEESGSVTEVVKNFVERLAKYSYRIGFHTSPFEIRPDAEGNWTIKGSENDHRDNDLSRAYYSLKYRHLYKKKNPRFIYVVRADPETHKTDGNWWRGSELSVVAQVPFDQVVDYVESTYKEKAAPASDAEAA